MLDLKGLSCPNMDLTISIVDASDEDTAGEIQSFIESQGGTYLDEDLPEMYFSIDESKANSDSLKGLNAWMHQINSVIVAENDSKISKNLIEELRNIWS